MAEKLKFIVSDEYNGMNAGRYLRIVCRLSARTLAVLKRTQGGLLRNGELLRSVDTVYAGDVVVMSLPSEENTIEPVKGDLDILYEDDYILIVNKPAYMPVHPVKSHQLDTLANVVSYRYYGSDSDFVFRAVNRLDANTSGIVVVARDRHTASLLQSSDITKHYFAVCHGETLNSATINAPIALRSDSKIVREVSECGQLAVTHYSKVKSIKNGSVLDVVIETGRTHQIRCHMSHIGFPLFGDDLYGGSRELITRQALHCYSVSFEHPFTAEMINITADIPEDISLLISKLSEG